MDNPNLVRMVLRNQILIMQALANLSENAGGMASVAFANDLRTKARQVTEFLNTTPEATDAGTR